MVCWLDIKYFRQKLKLTGKVLIRRLILEVWGINNTRKHELKYAKILDQMLMTMETTSQENYIGKTVTVSGFYH